MIDEFNLLVSFRLLRSLFQARIGDRGMIIYDGEKYACVSCIRGHRSSTCRHTSRMLVKVRSRGRHASLDIRKVIIVDTESQVTPDENSPACDGCGDSGGDASKECDKMNKQPILFLRTIRMQKAVLIDGKLKIIVEEDGSSGGTTEDGKPVYRYISEKEFLRQNSVALKNPNATTECSCNHVTEKNTIEATPEPKLELNENDIWKNAHGNSSAPMMDQAQIDDYQSGKPMFELLTHRGIYLSTQCSCKDGNCQCSNCLLHRNEEELNTYIQRSGVPLTNVGEATLASNTTMPHTNNCKCSAEECQCEECLEHPTEIIAFNRILFHGILNMPLKRKTIINFKGRLIPSQYWWDFLKLQVPLMAEAQLDYIDVTNWFEKIISVYDSQLLDASNFHLDVVNSMFNV